VTGFAGVLVRLIGETNLRLLGLLAILTIVFGSLVGNRLFGELGLRSMASQLPELGLLSLAMMVALLSAGLDLSVIATANLSALTVAFILTNVPATLSGPVAGWWQVGAVIAGILVAALVGLLNGTLIAYLRVSPILATLGTMTLVKGLAIGLTHGGVVSGFPPAIVFLGNGSMLGVPMPIIIFAAVALPLGILLSRTPFGIIVALAGSNERAVRYSGIDTRRILLFVYLLCSAIASLAGLVMMARFNSANAAYGDSYLLVTILACVLGGISPMGGFGKVSGLVIALIILQLISTACVLLNLSQFLTLSLWGGILIVVALGDAIKSRFAPVLLARRRPQSRPSAQGSRSI